MADAIINALISIMKLIATLICSYITIQLHTLLVMIKCIYMQCAYIGKFRYSYSPFVIHSY